MSGSQAPPRPLELTRLAAEHLAGKGIEEARLDAELLLAHVLGVRRLDLYLQFERPMEPDEVAAYREAVRRRARREPLQHITGEVEFREITLKVGPEVLIPRPETEVLVGEVLAWADARAGASDDTAATAPPTRLTALDVGTGSGAIALSLLHEGPFRSVVATDVSEAALAMARENGERTGLSEGLELRRGPVWEPVGGAERFDVIVSNPPYVAERDRATLEPEVAEHEPEAALFAGPDGLRVLRELAEGAASRLRPGGLLALEVGLGQAATVADWLRAGGFEDPRVVEDLTGRERIVLAARAGSADREHEER